ncbi:hypothetical protein ACIOUE_35685 [Streptomyces xanthochromogenes]|uniref:hypothetical protein n=1 Tax=Streptomyces xanthochromogenes TaxID=67384 RepID=UPI003814D636
MNGEKQNGEKPQQPTDIWTPVTVPSDPAGYADQFADYERNLEAAGYGDTQRQRYLDESGDPEYAACQWDEMILPGAEAAGIIPARPVEPLSPVEQARDAARAHASSEYYQQHPDDAWEPWDNNPAKETEYKTFVATRTTAILQEVGPDLAERIERAGTWEKNTVGELYAQRSAAPDHEPEREVAEDDIDFDM